MQQHRGGLGGDQAERLEQVAECERGGAAQVGGQALHRRGEQHARFRQQRNGVVVEVHENAELGVFERRVPGIR